MNVLAAAEVRATHEPARNRRFCIWQLLDVLEDYQFEEAERLSYMLGLPRKLPFWIRKITHLNVSGAARL